MASTTPATGAAESPWPTEVAFDRSLRARFRRWNPFEPRLERWLPYTPKRHVGVLVIHGIGANDINYANPFMRALMQELGRSERERVHWHPVFWADVIRPHQMGYAHRAHGMNFMWYRRTRRFVLSALADAASYSRIGDPNESVYEDIQKKITRGIRHLKDQGDENRPLIVVAHSLGCHIMSSYIHDTWRDRLRAKQLVNKNGAKRKSIHGGLVNQGAAPKLIEELLANAEHLDASRVSDSLSRAGRDRRDIDSILREALARLCEHQIAAIRQLDAFKSLPQQDRETRIAELLDDVLSLMGARLREDMRRRGLPEESIDDRLRNSDDLNKSRFEDLQSLVGFYTIGCNIPVFTFRFHPFQITPIAFPSGTTTPQDRPAGENSEEPDTPASFRGLTEWVNFFSPFDPLGYPLKPISPDYARRVFEDQSVLSGGLLTHLTPWSHTGYWTHPVIIRRIAAQIRRVLNA